MSAHALSRPAAVWRDQAERPRMRLGTGWEAPTLLAATVLLLCVGLVTVYSASAVMAQSRGLPGHYYIVRQAAGAAAGLVLLAGMAHLDYRHLRLLAWPLLIAVVIMLLITILPGTQAIAPIVNGARRSLDVGLLHVQPSEFAKFAIIVWTAALAVKKQEKLVSLSRGLLPFLLVWSGVGLLIFVQPSASAAVLVLLLGALVIFAGGARIGHFLVLGIVGVPLLWTQLGAAAYRMRRIATFLDPTTDPAGNSYQITQALIAIGSGGPLGRGFGHGLQKYGYLPEPHNDFIFAMIGEEWGFVGMLLLLVLYASIALIGYRIARQATDRFGFLLAIGLTNLIVVQALLHVAVNLAVIPTTGVTLSFLSYGRSSLLVCLAAVGVLLNIARSGAVRE